MSKAPGSVVEQAQRLVDCARLRPVGEGARALEQAVTMLQAAQTQLLVDAERSGELKDSGCAGVRCSSRPPPTPTAGPTPPTGTEPGAGPDTTPHPHPDTHPHNLREG
jgi:hypothetical protein